MDPPRGPTTTDPTPRGFLFSYITKVTNTDVWQSQKKNKSGFEKGFREIRIYLELFCAIISK